jgi:hypothetical protein
VTHQLIITKHADGLCLKVRDGLDGRNMHPAWIDGQPELWILHSDRYPGYLDWVVDRLTKGPTYHMDGNSVEDWKKAMGLQRKSA